MRQRRLLPRVEILDFRVLLSGIATDYAVVARWPSATITYSIAPDGEGWNGATNDINATLSAQLGIDWGTQLDRAMATWGAVANITFVKVVELPSSGEGAFGLSQGDPRFGDIRLGGYNFGPTSNYLGTTYYPTPGTTLGGDLSVNTGDLFHIGSDIDLYSLLLHETGHALGLAHASDPGDVMYPNYQGVRTGLGLGDIAGIQSLYGAKTVISPPPPPVPAPIPPVVVTPPPAPPPKPVIPVVVPPPTTTSTVVVTTNFAGKRRVVPGRHRAVRKLPRFVIVYRLPGA